MQEACWQCMERLLLSPLSCVMHLFLGVCATMVCQPSGVDDDAAMLFRIHVLSLGRVGCAGYIRDALNIGCCRF